MIIKDEESYQLTIKRIEELKDKGVMPGDDEEQELCALLYKVGVYEDEHFPISEPAPTSYEKLESISKALPHLIFLSERSYIGGDAREIEVFLTLRTPGGAVPAHELSRRCKNNEEDFREAIEDLSDKMLLHLNGKISSLLREDALKEAKENNDMIIGFGV